MSEILAVGLDLAKDVFQAHGADSAAGLSYARSWDGIRFLRFSASCRPASWLWKPAAAPTSGAARSASWATSSVSFRPSM